MAARPPHSIILSYAEDCQQLIVHTIDSDRLAPLIADKPEMPIPLDEFDFTLDDEFAQLFGGAMLGLIAFGRPGLKQYMSVSSWPVPQTGD